jgi:SAM-dependent methyltransferase
MKDETDAFGHALLDWAKGGTAPEIVERDDGFTDTGAGPEVYLSDFRGWPGAERQAVRQMRGRILDVGCGAGRVTLNLQQRGMDVVGLDSSRLALQAAKILGVENVWNSSIDNVSQKIRTFDTLVLFGNNFGVFGTPERARQLLSEWALTAKPDTRILIESTNPYCGGAPSIDRGYYHRNKARGFMPGQAYFRYHYGHVVGDWFPWLFVSRDEIRHLVRGTGWRITRTLGEKSSEPFVAILEKM